MLIKLVRILILTHHYVLLLYYARLIRMKAPRHSVERRDPIMAAPKEVLTARMGGSRLRSIGFMMMKTWVKVP
jgi:hypothetical protein